ncbi:hypothetical protein Tco_0257759 [Tanacetum coccineum]
MERCLYTYNGSWAWACMGLSMGLKLTNYRIREEKSEEEIMARGEEYKGQEGEVSDDEEMTQVKVLMALADDKLVVCKNHARNGEWIDITMKVNILLSMDKDVDWQTYLKYINSDIKLVERAQILDNKFLNFNTGRILVSESQVVNECLKLTEAPTNLEFSKDSGLEPLTPLPQLKNLQGASLSSEVMPLTYQDHLSKRDNLVWYHENIQSQKHRIFKQGVSRPVNVVL